MRAPRLLLAATLVVLAIAASLLAADVRAWDDAFDRDDARYLAQRNSEDWRPELFLPIDPAGRLLGTRRDADLRRALVLFRRARARGGVFDELERQGARGAAEAALLPIVRGDAARRAAQAANLLGALAFGDARSGARDAATPVERAFAAFEQAYRLDRSNEAAKYNLELVTRLLEARGSRPGSNPGAGSGSGGRRGAGSGRPGQGY